MLLDYAVACGDCGHIADEHEGGGAPYEPCAVSGCDCCGYVVDEEDYQQLAVGGYESERLTLAEAEKIIGEPASAWAARCFEIASGLAARVGGVAVYGAWDGPVAPGTVFSDRSMVNHGWVLLDNGDIFDPTRWVFEGLEPYLYEGPSDYYDEGANRRRASFNRPLPPAQGPVTTLDLPAEVSSHLSGVVGKDVSSGLSASEWMWVANLPYDDFAGHAPVVFAALDETSMGAFVPIDNKLRAERAAT